MSAKFPPRYLFAAFLLAASAAPRTAAAAEFVYCVSTPVELLAAMFDAGYEAKSSTHDIRIVKGSYAMTNPLFFYPDNKDDKVFKLRGGFEPGCSLATRTIDPSNTTVEFTSSNYDNRKVTLSGNNKSYLVEGIRFKNVSEFKVDDDTCGLFDICPDTDSIIVRYNEFRDSRQVVLIAIDAAQFVVSNNLFDGINGVRDVGSDNPVRIWHWNDERKVDFSFNTFGKISCGAGLAAIDYYSESSDVIHDNIFTGVGCSSSLYLDPDIGLFERNAKPQVLRNNLYKSISGQAPDSNVDPLINVDPGFIDAAGHDFHLRQSGTPSPAIDKGMFVVDLTVSGLTYPGQDLDGPGGTRLAGLYFDMGAYEAPVTPPNPFVVTNTNDAGAGSLRDAIDQANLQQGAQTIKFNIAGGCPRKIALETSLPDITDDVTIDGYTQPGATVNTATIANSAIICVVLGPASGTLSYALRVPDAAPASATLTLRGIGFTGGHSTALSLRGGSGHIIEGNAFGGVRPGGLDTLGDTNITHIGVRANAQGVRIGGPGPEDRNWLGTSQLNAIILVDATSNGHVVQNNYIGLDPGGAVPQGIGNHGISAQNSANIQVLDNVIDGAVGAGISISGATATGWQIKGNRIGVDAYGGMSVSAGNTYGIDIYGGSGGHVIGSTTGTARSNIIANNEKAGVWIESTAGNDIVVRPNAIYDNGTSGTGLGIDLNALGPLANDPLDGDTGGDRAQNTPELLELKDPAFARVLKGKLSSAPNATFRVDLYLSSRCPGGNRGGDLEARASTFDVTTDANGDALISRSIGNKGGYYTATAMRVSTGDTSEVSGCIDAGLFRDSFE
jgi:hypothetical protein